MEGYLHYYPFGIFDQARMSLCKLGAPAESEQGQKPFRVVLPNWGLQH